MARAAVALVLLAAIAGCTRRPAATSVADAGCAYEPHDGRCALRDLAELPAGEPDLTVVHATYQAIGEAVQPTRDFTVAVGDVTALRRHLAGRPEVPCHWRTPLTPSCGAGASGFVIDTPPFP